MLVYQTNSVGVKPFPYLKTLLSSNKFVVPAGYARSENALYYYYKKYQEIKINKMANNGLTQLVLNVIRIVASFYLSVCFILERLINLQKTLLRFQEQLEYWWTQCTT